MFNIIAIMYENRKSKCSQHLGIASTTPGGNLAGIIFAMNRWQFQMPPLIAINFPQLIFGNL